MSKKLKTLEEHNDEASKHIRLLYSNEPIRNGIACPKCGEEMFDTDPMVTLMSMPPKKSIHCECGYRDYRVM